MMDSIYLPSSANASFHPLQMQVSETEVRLKPFSDFVSYYSTTIFVAFILHVLVMVTTITPSSSGINYRKICSSKCNVFQ